jgi:hypothetical protein
VFAVRTFWNSNPFGNSDYIPFSRSYFLVVQMTTGLGNLIVLDLDAVEQKMINEANMKIAFSSEFRFKILGRIKGHFADAGLECLRQRN